ncbi:hypothetical protein SAMN05421805_107183 [Saccharopolyspora antimicrobica]|uniref:Uncharacterized protein n=1 Tax=Saccharopolyspora antimicrobica TaxID=455193 RepID=A0A1I5CH96_9PSEU|nr:hypothetical protein [Saccharopolyspora antimicrobica]RKT88854.1 hypothetical protein ATL45_7297 [Saccharopolyspora antimicrobica]SFN86380.1 hypothetical protein SAMN05421805_107183 [Saccharopolyspora antimicrobica]
MIRIEISGDRALLTGAEATGWPEPATTGLVEARGALLSWDVTSNAAFPHAQVHDPDAAAGWLWEIYGDDIADAVLANAPAKVALPPERPELLPAALRLARLNWAAAWWPASAQAAIPALSQELLAAETAVATAALEHLLDDEDCVERALDAASLTAVEALAEHAAFAASAIELAEELRSLAEDYGVELDAARVSGQAGWALAAGGTHQAAATGTSSLNWADVPAQTLDAMGGAGWSIGRRGDETVLSVSVPAAPAVEFPHHEPPLTPVLLARFGPARLGVEVPLRRVENRFTGEAVLPVTALLLPTAERTLSVRDTRITAEPSAVLAPAEDVRAAVIDHARSRLADATASLAEQAAAHAGGIS